ncbi:MAG: cytochrome P450, partial [Pseudomonadota bacterium]
RIIARILGLPEADIPEFTRAVYTAIQGVSITKPEVMAEAGIAMTALMRYVGDLLAARRARPEEDFLTEYVARTGESDLDAEEIRAQIVTLIIAGSDTTRAALTATLSRLLQEPGEWQRLTADPAAHVEGAVAEGLRTEPVIGAFARVLTRRVEMEGYRLEEGTVVGSVSLTALRDPAIYTDPDRFDITRQDHPRLHPIFGAGPHRCLGEALARAELEEALGVIAREAPNTRLIGPPAELRGLGAVRRIFGMETALRA